VIAPAGETVYFIEKEASMDEAVQLVEVLTHTKFVELVRFGKPVDLRKCTIKGKVDLSYCRLPAHIVCEDCTFDSQFLAVEARFGRSVSFAGCKFEGGIDWTGAQVDGVLGLSGSKIAVAESLTGAERCPADILTNPKLLQRAGLGRMTIRGPDWFSSTAKLPATLTCDSRA